MLKKNVNFGIRNRKIQEFSHKTIGEEKSYSVKPNILHFTSNETVIYYRYRSKKLKLFAFFK